MTCRFQTPPSSPSRPSSSFSYSPCFFPSGSFSRAAGEIRKETAAHHRRSRRRQVGRVGTSDSPEDRIQFRAGKQRRIEREMHCSWRPLLSAASGQTGRPAAPPCTSSLIRQVGRTKAANNPGPSIERGRKMLGRKGRGGDELWRMRPTKGSLPDAKASMAGAPPDSPSIGFHVTGDAEGRPENKLLPLTYPYSFPSPVSYLLRLL